MCGIASSANSSSERERESLHIIINSFWLLFKKLYNARVIARERHKKKVLNVDASIFMGLMVLAPHIKA